MIGAFPPVAHYPPGQSSKCLNPPASLGLAGFGSLAMFPPSPLTWRRRCSDKRLVGEPLVGDATGNAAEAIGIATLPSIVAEGFLVQTAEEWNGLTLT